MADLVDQPLRTIGHVSPGEFTGWESRESDKLLQR